MPWNPDVFFPAFKRAGMLNTAVLMPQTGPATEFDVDFRRPDQVVLEGMVHSTGYSIEYQAADVTLNYGDTLVVAGTTYKVSQPPDVRGDGSFVIAQLEKVAP
ncbi:MAG: hypothetical protein K2X55_01010 [Burkholderiaceae bacterium]|nr:hypothetical protein [Burkholderiaceae bacterium]